MKNSFSLHKPTLSSVSENLSSLHNFFKDSYKGGKREFSERVSLLKEGLSGAYDKTSTCVNLLTLPINNFLKDIAQIEREFQEELSKNTEHCVCLDGKMMPVSEILSRPMEENY